VCVYDRSQVGMSCMGGMYLSDMGVYGLVWAWWYVLVCPCMGVGDMSVYMGICACGVVGSHIGAYCDNVPVLRITLSCPCCLGLIWS
jgi:hypothetical protein